jgi:beta-carotene hydroxylase
MTGPDPVWRKPTIRELGPDLLRISRPRRTVALALPFVCFAGYFAFAAVGSYLPALLSVVALSFLTYGSVSHDLVHANLGLSPAANRRLLSCWNC